MHSSYIKPYPPVSLRPLTAMAQPWRVPHLCASYGWPTSLPGRGKIAIIELGGGWSWNDAGRFFGALNQPVPHIVDVSVDGAANTPGDDADAEVALDIQVAGASFYAATGAPADIRVYWARNTIDAIAKSVAKASADGCDVCSISWGAREPVWGYAAALEMEQVAQAASLNGMVIFAASGDNNSSDGGSEDNVDLPAACPHVIACGGTMRPHKSSPERPEVVWNNDPGNANGSGTGGGFSSFFPMPTWQAGAPTGPGRMVPDLAANADPWAGYHIVLDGDDVIFGGTSAVAPLYAGLFAAFGKKLGFVTPRLFLHHLAFNDIRAGDNGNFRARPGPDACTGIGSPRGAKLVDLIAGARGPGVRLINKKGLDLIKRWEGLFLTAYRDIAGIWTIGWGHTGGVHKGQVITVGEAERLLRLDLAEAEVFIDARCVSNDNQFAAMVSLAFNIGNGAFLGSTVLRKHKAGDFEAAADAFLLWRKAHVDGELVDVPGLLNRRRDERVLYLTP